MFERKLYLTGLGGNRYETTMEDLKDLAYVGKIKRSGLVIVVETSDGGAPQEKKFRCDQIKGVSDLFEQGERDREDERAREERERAERTFENELARKEREREKEANRKARARQKSARYEERLREQEELNMEKELNNERRTKERREQLKREDKRMGRTALKKVKRIIFHIKLLFATFLLINVAGVAFSDRFDEKVQIFMMFAGCVFVVILACCYYRVLMIPVYLTQYHAERSRKRYLSRMAETNTRTRSTTESRLDLRRRVLWRKYGKSENLCG